MNGLTAAQLGELERELTRLWEASLAEVRAAMTDTSNQHMNALLGHEPGDSGDQSVADALADFNTAMFDKQIRALREIEAARERLAQGSYGTCEDCGETILAARLHALPTASRCIACQSKREHGYAHPGTPSL